MSSRRWYVCGALAAGLTAGLLTYCSRQSSSPEVSVTLSSQAPRTNLEEAVTIPIAAEASSASPLTTPAEEVWHRRWRELMVEPGTTARNEDAVTFLEELAATDPLRAISFAQKESAAGLKMEFLQAALRGWGGTAAEAAIAWATTQTNMDAGEAIAAVFHGAARDPESALRLATKLSEQNPERMLDYSSALIGGLNRAGEFGQAAAFATASPAAFRVDLLNAAYSQWVKSEPKAVLESISRLSDPDTKRRAFDAAMSRWSHANPEEAVAYASSLPAGSERDFALNAALRSWADRNPTDAAGWMNRFEPSSGLDYGSAILASQPEALRQPQIATSWAENIVDPQLRTRVLAAIVKEWSAVDPIAARRYAETSPTIRAEDRAGVLAAFEKDFTLNSLLP